MEKVFLVEISAFFIHTGWALKTTLFSKLSNFFVKIFEKMAKEINLCTNFFQNIIKNKKGNLLKKRPFFKQNLLILLKKGINNKDFEKKFC